MRSQFQIIRIPGDGRCLFRSVVYGACLRSGKLAPSEVLQKELADELRENVANELMKRRLDTERFIEGDFGQYVRHMRQPHVWGGEPELLMSSHVLHSSRILRPRVFCSQVRLVSFEVEKLNLDVIRMPISVYMCDKSGNLKVIAEYGQEYGKENPIRVLFHSYGHYDSLKAPCN